MKNGLIFFILLSLGSALIAQSNLEGLWEGTITEGGLQSDTAYKFELYLQKEGKELKGRSYVYLNGKEVIEMEVFGTLYGDFSIYLRDNGFVPLEGFDVRPRFSRKYQLMYKPSIWETKLEGFWQEIIPEPFFYKRDRGRILLKKIREKKTKA